MFLFETALSFLTLCFFNSYIPDYSLIGMISTILCLIVAASTRWKTRLGGDFFASIVFFSISAINIVVHIIFGYSSGCILQYAQGIALAVTLLFNSMYFVDGSIKGTLKKIEIPILDYHSDCYNTRWCWTVSILWVITGRVLKTKKLFGYLPAQGVASSEPKLLYYINAVFSIVSYLSRFSKFLLNHLTILTNCDILLLDK